MGVPEWGHTLILREKAQKLCSEPSYTLLRVSLHLPGLDLFPYNDNYKLEIEV